MLLVSTTVMIGLIGIGCRTFFVISRTTSYFRAIFLKIMGGVFGIYAFFRRIE